MRALLVTLLIAGCDAPCEPERLEGCAGCGPGELRAGVRMPLEGPRMLAGAGGVTCVACDAVYRFDRDARALDRVALHDADRVAVARTGELYALRAEHDEEYEITHYRLVALDATGGLRWRVELASYPRPVDLVATASAVYVVLDKVGTDDHVAALAAADGTRTWTMPGNRVVPDDRGRLFVFRDVFAPGLLGTGTIALVDEAGGAVQWQRELTATTTAKNSAASIHFRAATVTPAGELVIAGDFSTTLALDGRELAGDAYTGFVAAFDATGTTRWAHAITDVALRDLVVTTAGEHVVVGGTYIGSGGSLQLPDPMHGTDPSFEFDGFLALYDASGPLRLHHFGGEDFQGVVALRDAGDGTVWAAIETRTHGGTELAIGTRRFASDGTERRYVVNLMP